MKFCTCVLVTTIGIFQEIQFCICSHLFYLFQSCGLLTSARMHRVVNSSIIKLQYSRSENKSYHMLLSFQNAPSLKNSIIPTFLQRNGLELCIYQGYIFTAFLCSHFLTKLQTQHLLLMPYIKALLFLSLFRAIVFTLNITTLCKKIQLNNTKQNTLAIFSHDKVMVGYQNGKLQIIDIQHNKLNKSFSHFRDSVDSITVLDQRRIFVNDDTKILMLDNLGQVLKKWQGSQKNIEVIVAYNATGMGYMSIIKSKVIEQHIFQNVSFSSNYINFFNTGQHGADFAAYSPLHTHLYIVNNQKNKIIIYQLAQATIFDIGAINKTFTNTSNQNKTQDSIQSKWRQVKNREMQKRVLEVMNNNRQYIILERKFNFKIKQILTDYKQAKLYNEALIIVSQEDTVYYTTKANILTFLPFKNNTQDQLISICFCQKVYLLILHRHLTQDQKVLFYLSFFNKETLVSQKIVQLSTLFPDLKSIKAMDCNFKRITFLTYQSQLLIIENQYQQQKIESISTQLNTTLIQWGSTIIIIAFFLFCCRRKSDKKQKIQKGDQKSFSKNEKPGQINEVQSKKLDQLEKKTSQNSSQQQNKIKQKQKEDSHKQKLFQKQKSKHNKNKKKSN